MRLSFIWMNNVIRDTNYGQTFIVKTRFHIQRRTHNYVDIWLDINQIHQAHKLYDMANRMAKNRKIIFSGKRKRSSWTNERTKKDTKFKIQNLLSNWRLSKRRKLDSSNGHRTCKRKTIRTKCDQMNILQLAEKKEMEISKRV